MIRRQFFKPLLFSSFCLFWISFSFGGNPHPYRLRFRHNRGPHSFENLKKTINKNRKYSSKNSNDSTQTCYIRRNQDNELITEKNFQIITVEIPNNSGKFREISRNPEHRTQLEYSSLF